MDRVLVVLLIGMSSVTIGCAQSHCSIGSNSTDPDCQRESALESTAVAVMPPRVAIAPGSSTPIVIHADPELASQTVLLKQGMAEMSLGTLNKSGSLTTSVAATDLKANNFVPGPAQAVIVDQQATVRIYLGPNFGSTTTAVPSRSVANDCTYVGCTAYSASLGVFLGNIIAANYYVNSQAGNVIDLHSYKLNGTNIDPSAILQTQALAFGVQAGGIAATDAALFSAENVNSAPEVLSCASPSNNQTCNSQGLGINSISSLLSYSANKYDVVKLYGAIINGKVGAYSQPNLSGPNSYQVSMDDPNQGQKATQLAVAEINGDSNPDLIIWYPNGSLSVYTSTGSSSLEHNPAYSMAMQQAQAGTTNMTVAATGDIDGDGLDDIVVSDGNAIYVIINQGDATFSLAQTINVPSTVMGVTALAIGAVNPMGQGISDIVISSQIRQTIAVLENQAQY